MPLFVKLYPHLSAAALKSKHKKELCLWYELRALDVTGYGLLNRDNAIAGLIAVFGYSERTADRILKAGDGKFWLRQWNSRKGAQIKIQSLENVCKYLDIVYPGKPVRITAPEFEGRLKKTAWLYAAFHKPEGKVANPISRDSVESTTGVNRRQQQRYEAAVGVKKEINHAHDGNGNHMYTTVISFSKTTGKSKQYRIKRQLPNTYHNLAERVPRGMTKKVSRKLKTEFYYRDEASSNLLRRYFRSARSAIKCTERHDESFLLMFVRDMFGGDRRWCLV